MKITIRDDGEFKRPTIVGNRDAENDATEAARYIEIAELVHACHETSIPGGLNALGLAQMEQPQLDDILVYCAEQRCAHDNATCANCRLRTKAEGFVTFDQFLSAHRNIEFKNTDVSLSGPGDRQLQVQSLSDLAKTWSGVEYWYWARRVLRKLRHGVRRAGSGATPFSAPGETPAIILVKPQLADNIGMCARAMANFGLDEMRLVNPRDGWPNERARVAASGANYVIDSATNHTTLDEAVSDLNWVCATTARQRALNKPVLSPEKTIAEMAKRIERGERCGVIFGAESSGLASDDIAEADALTMIPVNNAFASLNLAQAVLILGYSWILTRDDRSLGRVTKNELRKAAGPVAPDEQPATKQELSGFFTHLERELDARGFFHPLERKPTVSNNLKTLFTRAQPSSQEVRTLRGIVATLVRTMAPPGKSE